MSELSIYYGNNIKSFRDDSSGYTTNVYPNSDETNMLLTGSYTNVFEDSVGPFSGAPEPVISINGMEYNTLTGDNIKLNASLALLNNDTKYAQVTLSSDAKDLNPTVPHILAFYFKIGKKYSNLPASRNGRINAEVDSIVFKNKAYTKETKVIVPWSQTDVSKMSSLVDGKWYLAVSFVSDGYGAFNDANGIS